VPLDKVRMMINMDMIGRLRNDRLEVSGTRTGEGLRQLVGMHNGNPDLVLDFTWEIEDNSDHYPFFERGIPILMLHTGLHDEYHRPSDDAHLINSEGMERIGRLLLGVIDDAANRDTLPEFRRESRYESPSDSREYEQSLPPLPSRLGVRWSDDSEAAGEGLRIVYVTPGSPAAQAGIQPGDVFTKFNDQELATGDDLRRAVFQAPKSSTVAVDREGQEEPLDIALELDGQPMRLGIAWRTNDAEPSTVMLTRVVPGSPAAEAGLQVRDRIYRVNGQSFGDTSEFLEMATRPDGKIGFLVERDGKLLDINVELLPIPEPATAQTNGSTSTSQPLAADR